jgi:hypothetical protein
MTRQLWQLADHYSATSSHRCPTSIRVAGMPNYHNFYFSHVHIHALSKAELRLLVQLMLKDLRTLC